MYRILLTLTDGIEAPPSRMRGDNFLEQLYEFKNQFTARIDEEAEFLRILLPASNENMTTMKIVKALSKRKAADFAQDIVQKAEERRNKLMKKSDPDLEQAEMYL